MSGLKALLKEKKVSQAELARLLGRDKSVITHLFQGKRQLKLHEAMKIAEYLGVPLSNIAVEGEEEAEAAEAALTGMEDTLVPFRHEPSGAVRRSQHVHKQGGKFYFGAAGSFSDKAYALEMSDDSLNLSGVLPGDVLISELDAPCRPHDLVVVQHYEGEGAQTLVRRYESPFLVPHSTDSRFRPLNQNTDDVRVVSPVVRLVRLF